MKIEKNFYDIMMQESDEIEAEIALEESLLSEEDRNLLKEKRSREAQHIIELANEKMRRTWHIHDPQKTETFNQIRSIAMEFAKDNHMNISVEADSTTGRIKLKTPFLHFGVLTPNDDKEVILALIESADSFMVQAEDGLLRMDFDYTLTTSIEK